MLKYHLSKSPDTRYIYDATVCGHIGYTVTFVTWDKLHIKKRCKKCERVLKSINK